MKNIQVDARGLACPQPVVVTKEALTASNASEIIVLVDSDIARENVIRFGESQGCSAETSATADGSWRILLVRETNTDANRDQSIAPTPSTGELVLLFDSDFVGTSRDLGKVLLNGFLHASLSLPEAKGAVVLISNGVRLVTEGSYALDSMERVINRGWRILICGTCLDFFKIREKVCIGTVSNALEILECLSGAGRVVKF